MQAGWWFYWRTNTIRTQQHREQMSYRTPKKCRLVAEVPENNSSRKYPLQEPRTRRQNSPPGKAGTLNQAKNSTHRQAQERTGPNIQENRKPKRKRDRPAGTTRPTFHALGYWDGPVCSPAFSGLWVGALWPRRTSRSLGRCPFSGQCLRQLWGSVPFRFSGRSPLRPWDIPVSAYHMNTWEEKWECSSLRLTHHTVRVLRGVLLRLHKSPVGVLLLC